MVEKHHVAFVVTLIGGLWTLLGGFQAMQGSDITGNVIGASVGNGMGVLVLVAGLLLAIAAFVMLSKDKMKTSGMFAVVAGIVAAVVSFGASLLPAVVSVIGGLVAMQAAKR